MALLLAGLLLLATQEEFELSKDEIRMITAINEYRAAHQLPPLQMDPTLMRVARYRAPHFTHCHEGRWIWDECRRFHFNGFATDDLAQGQQNPEEAVECWANSTVGHAMQMRGLFNMNDRWVDYRFDRVGVAHSGRNWIAIFGKRDRSKVD